MGELVGYVEEAWIYPIRGIGGMSVKELSLRDNFIAGDQMMTFEGRSTDKGIVSFSRGNFPSLLFWRGYPVDPATPEETSILIDTPQKTFDPESEESIQEFKKIAETTPGMEDLEVYRVYSGIESRNKGIFLLTLSTLKLIESEAGSSLRGVLEENLLINSISGRKFPEAWWIGGYLNFGDREDSARVKALMLKERSGHINFNSEEDEKLKQAIKEYNQYNQGYKGLYCITDRTGTIRVGDKVYLESPSPSDKNE